MMYLLAVMNDSDGPLLIALAVAALVVILASSSSTSSVFSPLAGPLGF